jgi:glycopeptide antibiotics resistance protein
MSMDISIKDKGKSFEKLLLYFTMAVYAYLLYSIILNKGYVSSPMELFSTDRPMLRSVNLIPFKEIWSPNMSVSFNKTSILGNIALFIPLGIYLPMLFNKKKASITKHIVFIALVSLSFELFQYVFSTGVTDINDIILNTFGGFLGILMYNALTFILKEDKAKKLIIVIGGVVAILMFLLEVMIIIANGF